MPIKNAEQKRLLIKGRKFDTDTGIFEGYASVFGNVDSDDDVIEKGAYSKFLAGDWSRVKILALHNEQWLPIGKPIELFEDDVGLYLKAKISDTSMGADIIQLLKDGVLDELSVGFVILDGYKDNNGIRHLTEIELLEVSIVSWAANDKAKILDVKSQKTKSELSPEALIKVAKSLEQQAALLKSEAARIKSESENKSKSSFDLPAILVTKTHRKNNNTGGN